MNKLETISEWTIDRRLKQFRRCEGGWENGGKIEFIDFDTEIGDLIFELKFLADEINELEEQMLTGEITKEDFTNKSNEIFYVYNQTKVVIDNLVKETNK
jgi:hypothetical protein